MNSKIATALWLTSVSTAGAVIYLLYQTLWVPPLAEANTEGDILLARVINRVNHRAAGSIAWGDAEPGYMLQENDAIRAGEASIAEIVFDDETRIVLQENSMVIIKALGKNADGSLQGASLMLDEGQVNFVRKKKKKRKIVGLREEPEDAPVATPPSSTPDTAKPAASGESTQQPRDIAPEPGREALAEPGFERQQFEGEEIVDPLTEEERLAEPPAASTPEDEFIVADDAPFIRIETKDVALDVSGGEGSLKAGKEAAELSIDRGQAKIETNTGTIKVNSKTGKSTKLELKKSKDDQENVQVAALEGEAELDIDGEKVQVDEKESSGVVFSKQGKAKKVLIPPPPKLKSDDIRVSLGDFMQGAAQLQWKQAKPLTGAESDPRYRINLYKRGDIANPMKTFEVVDDSFVASELAPGEYLYTVATIQDSVVGKESPPKGLKITLPPPPRLSQASIELRASDVSKDKALTKWEPVDDGASANYRVRVYDKQQPQKPILTEDVKDTELVLASLPPGRYTYNVSTLLLGHEGRPSPSREINIIDETLLKPPVPDPRRSDRKIEYTDANQSARLVWTPSAPEQEKYRLQIARSASFSRNSLVLDDVLTEPQKKVSLRSGNYFWRVASIAGEETLGDYSEPLRLQVIKIVPPAVFLTQPMKYDLVYSDIVDIEGKTDPQNTVKLQMVWAGNETLKVASDGTYRHKLRIRRGRNKFTISIRNPAGQVAERVHELVYLPQQLSKSSTVEDVKEEVDEINEKLRRAYEQLEKLRQVALSDSSKAGLAQQKADQVEAVAEKLEFQVKQEIAKLDAFTR